MPLFVKATPARKGEKNIYGPYPESKLLNAVTYARMSSAKAKYRPRREVYWKCGRRAPLLIRVYERGERVYPRGDDRAIREQYEAIKACMKGATSRCRTREHIPTEASLRRAKKLPKKFVCPL